MGETERHAPSEEIGGAKKLGTPKAVEEEARRLAGEMLNQGNTQEAARILGNARRVLRELKHQRLGS